jgi:hypothetical protein
VRLCPNPTCDGGTVHDVLRWRQPPPGNAVFEKVYLPSRDMPDSTILEVHVDRPCIICVGKGEVAS